MADEAQRRGRVLMVGHLLQYHPAILKFREILDAEVLGRIEYIYSNRLSMAKIRKEENALWSFAPHDISVILMLTGALPVQVISTGGAYLPPNVADVTVSHLLFDRGTRAHIFVSWLHPYKEQRLVVIGSNQMVVFEDSKKEDKLVLFNKAIEYGTAYLRAESQAVRRCRSTVGSRCGRNAGTFSNAWKNARSRARMRPKASGFSRCCRRASGHCR